MQRILSATRGDDFDEFEICLAKMKYAGLRFTRGEAEEVILACVGHGTALFLDHLYNEMAIKPTTWTSERVWRAYLLHANPDPVSSIIAFSGSSPWPLLDGHCAAEFVRLFRMEGKQKAEILHMLYSF